MTKEDFFKMKDLQRESGEIVSYVPDQYENRLSVDEENVLLEALRSQKSGMYRTEDLGLNGLLCVEIYEGIQLRCQRRRCDELDNITVWRI